MKASKETRRSSTRQQTFLDDINDLYSRSAGGATPALLQDVLDAGVRAVEGTRGFLALICVETGELQVAYSTGPGWTEDHRRHRLHLAQRTRRGITGHVALSREPYVSGDVSRDPHYLRFWDDTRSEVAVPILGAQHYTRGVINIESERLDAFTHEDSARLLAIAQVAAVALGIDAFRSRERALIEIGKSLTTTHDLDALMRKVVEISAEAISFEDCSVFLVDPVTERLVLRASRGALDSKSGEAGYAMGQGLTGWVAEHGEAIRLDDPCADPRWLGHFTELPKDEIGPLLAVPIVTRDKVLGVLRVLRRKSQAPWYKNYFTDTDERILTTIAGQLGDAVEDARSFKRLVRAERMAAWGELSAKSAHMIGNRTFALEGDVNELEHLLLEAPCNEETRRESLQLVESMKQGITRLEEILHEFRDFVVATQLTLVKSDLNTIIRETARETFPKRCCVRMELSLAEDLPPIHCDPAKLQRAFGELIENAISFQPDGGDLRVETRRIGPEDRRKLHLAEGRSYVLAEFADRGPGVAAALKERIFQPFFTSRAKGMGLGLSIVKGIVEAHHGILRETGAEGEGARFAVYLPVNGT